MQTAELVGRRQGAVRRSPLLYPGLPLALLLGGGAALRLWGIGHGLPYAYNIDEAAQFVPRAVGMVGFQLNPHYFANPPALTYLLHLIYLLYFGSHRATVLAFSHDPATVYELARLTVAALGSVGVLGLYLCCAELATPAVGLVGAALGSFAFLPVFYSHLALNDVPALTVFTFALWFCARYQRRRKAVDLALGGLAVGLAAALKYTAGIALVAFLFAVFWPPRPLRVALLDLFLLLALGAVAFLVANPYALLDHHRFLAELGRESALAGESAGKLGAPREPALLYYLEAYGWGLGVAPALGALAGLVLALLRRERALLLLVPTTVAYLLYMGVQGRAFGRWLLPAFPAACFFSAFAVVWLARRLPHPVLAGALTVLSGAALAAQGLVHDLHEGAVLDRADTRTLARRWLTVHLPPAARIVVEPGVVEAAWLRVRPAPGATAAVPLRFENYPYYHWLLLPQGRGWRFARFYGREEDYAYTLTPALLRYYTETGYCYVVAASTQWGRTFADPARVPAAASYYRALFAEGRVVAAFSPYRRGAKPVPFSYDFSFDYYPLSYFRPGPVVKVVELFGNRCGNAKGFYASQKKS